MSEIIDLEPYDNEPAELEVTETFIEAVSPHVSTETIAGGTRVTITDIDGSHAFDVMDGADGQDGQDGTDGQDGVSPTVSTSAITGGTRVTITDGSGDHAFDVMNGPMGPQGGQGEKGDPADPLTITGTSRSWGITASADTMPSSWSSTVPTVEQGKYLWCRTRFEFSDGTVAYATNCAYQGMDGEKGDPGDDYVLTAADKQEIAGIVETSRTVTVSGTTPSITGAEGYRYICGEVSTLNITAPASGCIDVVFTSGSTATVLTVTTAKTGATLKWANGFDPDSLDADTVYEINILDGEFGVVGAWT